MVKLPLKSFTFNCNNPASNTQVIDDFKMIMSWGLIKSVFSYVYTQFILICITLVVTSLYLIKKMHDCEQQERKCNNAFHYMNWWRRIVLKIRSPKKKYQTEAERTRNSKQVRGRIMFEEGVSILSWLATLLPKNFESCS